MTCSCTIRTFSSAFLWPVSKNSHSGFWATQAGQNRCGEIHVFTTADQTHPLVWIPQFDLKQVDADLWLHVTQANTNGNNMPPTQPQISKAFIMSCKSLNINSLVVLLCVHTHAWTDTHTANSWELGAAYPSCHPNERDRALFVWPGLLSGTQVLWLLP